MTSRPKARSELLPPGAKAPRVARTIVRELLPDTDPRVAERAMLLTSEIVTNAVIHTAGDITLEAKVTRGVLRVVVEDTDDRLPAPVADAGPEGGFGLHIIDELADRWGVASRDDGKAVWFELAVAGKRPTLRSDGDLEGAYG